MTDQLAAALYFISPDDRDTWVRMAFAVKSDMGDNGFALWDSWSRQSESYNARAAQSTWRSAKPRSGGITVASLYHEAKQWGWQGFRPVSTRESSAAYIERKRKEEAEVQRQVKRAQLAAATAQIMIDAAEVTEHPYLAAKGFPEQKGLVLRHGLLLPMRNVRDGALQSVQEIDVEGNKRFLPGGKARRAVLRLGYTQRSAETWYCEGYATALSVRDALKMLYRRAAVVVCFSAHNLAQVTSHGYVVADNDKSDTGEKYAKQTGLPYWMPPEVGDDANDFHQKHGARALADALMGLL